MSKYLTALKGQDFGRANTSVLQELQEDPSCTFCSTQVSTPQKYRGLEPEPVCAPADPLALPTCEQCRNLGQRDRDGFRRCAAAARGELPYIASKRYAPVPDQGKRCEGYTPKPGDTDQRNGRERWPELMEVKQ